ncbi:MAG: methionyl-tRNA formyltransferase [Gammaproteobacteria bacterium]
MAMRIVFCGSGAFAQMAMKQLADALDIVLVASPPPKPRGRKLQIQSCPAAITAQMLNLPLLETADGEQAAAQMKAAKADAIVVADNGLLLPPSALAASPRGAINIHPSLLPRWRGAAPIARAILAGDKETGVCIMQMDEGLDTGAILMRQSIPLAEDKNCGELTAQLATLGAKLMIKTLQTNPPPVAQSIEGIVYARKLSKAENIINYDNPAQTTARQIRAFAPRRAARTIINGAMIGILKGAAIAGISSNGGEDGKGDNGGEVLRDNNDASSRPVNGEVLRADKNGIVIKCAQGAIVFKQLRREGKKPQPAEAFLRGFQITPGDRAKTLQADNEAI